MKNRRRESQGLPRRRRRPRSVTSRPQATRWRRETWLFLAWLVLSVGALIVVSVLGAAGLGLAECRASTDGVWLFALVALLNPSDACRDVLSTIALVGGVGLLVTGALWVLTRPARVHCPDCWAPVRRGAPVCPTCGCDLRGAFDSPPA